MMKNDEKIRENPNREIINIFDTAAENLRKEIKKERMGLSPLNEMREKLQRDCSNISNKDSLSSEDEILLFHLFLMNYYINHIMNHIAGDASCKLHDELLKEIASEIALGFEIYVDALNSNRAYEGLMRMPLLYLKKIRYIRGDKYGK